MMSGIMERVVLPEALGLGRPGALPAGLVQPCSKPLALTRNYAIIDNTWSCQFYDVCYNAGGCPPCGLERTQTARLIARGRRFIHSQEVSNLDALLMLLVWLCNASALITDSLLLFSVQLSHGELSTMLCIYNPLYTLRMGQRIHNTVSIERK